MTNAVSEFLGNNGKPRPVKPFWYAALAIAFVLGITLSEMLFGHELPGEAWGLLGLAATKTFDLAADAMRAYLHHNGNGDAPRDAPSS